MPLNEGFNFIDNGNVGFYKKRYLYYFRKNKFKKYIKPYWGYSNGKQVYIKYLGFLHPLKVYEKYSYCILEDRFEAKEVPKNEFFLAKYNKCIVLDMKSGEVNLLTVKLLRQIISDDKDLFNEFDNLKQQDKIDLKIIYLVKFIESN